MNQVQQVPLRSICRSLCQDAMVGSRRKQSMSMDASCYSMGDYSRRSFCDNGSSSSSSHGSDSISSMEEDDSILYESIDNLMDQLVEDATKRYAGSNPVMRVNKRVWSPEQCTIDLAVKRLPVMEQHLSTSIQRGGVQAGKSYYELRILATGSEHYACYDNDAITSVLIGYASLDGIDGGFHSRRFTFQDSQHLYKFCEVLGEKGRFEDAAF